MKNENENEKIVVPPCSLRLLEASTQFQLLFCLHFFFAVLNLEQFYFPLGLFFDRRICCGGHSIDGLTPLLKDGIVRSPQAS
jgi:hypothetical protein